MKFFATLILLPFIVTWFLIKVILTIFLILLGPFGWGIIAGWWAVKIANQPRKVVVVNSEGKPVEYIVPNK